MYSIAQYSIETVHSAIAASTGKWGTLPDGQQFKRESQRLILFSTTSVACSACGIEGKYYDLETHSTDVVPHLNLYAILPKSGAPVLMTKDHTIPKSKGGPNSMSNYTTMCAPCNGKKADTVIAA